MPFDLDLTKAQVLLTHVSNVFSPFVADQILVYAGDRVGAKANEIALEEMYPPASGNALPLYYTRTRKDGTIYKSKFKTLKQQRYVMALIDKGMVPYKRTGKLGQSMTWASTLQGSGIVLVRIGSNLQSAPYVLDIVRQSHYHKGTWEPLQQSIIDALPELNKVAVKAVISQVAKRLKGNG